MQIYIRNLHINMDDSTRIRIETMIQNKLKKYAGHILRVTIQLINFNGTRGGEDKSCRMEVRLKSNSNVFVENISSELLKSVDLAIDRAARAISKTIGRSRAIKRELLPVF